MIESRWRGKVYEKGGCNSYLHIESLIIPLLLVFLSGYGSCVNFPTNGVISLQRRDD